MTFISDFFLNGHDARLGIFFILLIALFLIFDLGFIHRKASVISFRSSLWQTIFWIAVSIIYGGIIYLVEDKKGESLSLDLFSTYLTEESLSLEFFSAYLTEKSLSLDNIFVIMLILQYFKIEEKYYHKILFWGVLGAVVFRAFFIFTGSILVDHFGWILYIFGAFLLYTGVKILFSKGDAEVDPEKSIFYRFLKKYAHLVPDQKDGKFFFRKEKILVFTPLFLALVLVESTDLIFAVDSIPAAFSITQDRFVVYTSNICAVMGLRAMFFLLSSVIEKFHLLQIALAVILMFIGVKMLLEMEILKEVLHFHIGVNESFYVIAGLLFFALILSPLFPARKSKPDKVKELLNP
ncbi:MAG: TerC/Alx family metal homeostasis membrane protein [Cytophagales bacterium]|nr:TerC/Alx family metal homeostasis membrane protein [Cytophagales bacterium]